MNALAPVTAAPNSLPALVRRAAEQLANAETSAQVLEAREAASLAYDAAKRAARIAKAKAAHDEIIGIVYRAQADALEIESAAKRRLADEYDAAQERGEVRTRADQNLLPDEKKVSVSDIGLTHKDIHEARQLRDAERDDPGVTRRALDDLIERGEEPTKAAVKRIIHPAAPVGGPVDSRALWLWGRLKDFERDGLLSAAPKDLLRTMTPPMLADTIRLAPLVADLLYSLENIHESA